jgi:hypothetical protein
MLIQSTISKQIDIPSSNPRAALVVAHPSHELRVHGWLQQAHPRAFVLTDGGGRAGQPRLPATTRVLTQVGVEPGAIYGQLADLDLYAAILSQNLDFFTELADELAESFVREQIDYVVGDAAEGYSSAHDICRMLINAAVEIARRKQGRAIRNFDFLVVGPPDEYSKTLGGEAIWVHLDDEMFARKIAAAHGYSPKLAADIEATLKGEKFRGIKRFSEPIIAGQVDVELGQMILTALKSRPELDAQVQGVLGGVELDAFRRECLRPVSDDGLLPDISEAPPFYEIYGEKLVAAGRYQRVIRYRQHIRPLADALRRHAAGSV